MYFMWNAKHNMKLFIDNKNIREKPNIDNSTIIIQKPTPEMFYKKGFLKSFAKFTAKHLCQSLFFIVDFKKETLAHVCPCEFCNLL